MFNIYICITVSGVSTEYIFKITLFFTLAQENIK